MTGAIHRPQRSTRIACSTRPTTPWALNRPRIGPVLRCRSAVRNTRLMLNSGAASDQLITPDSDSL